MKRVGIFTGKVYSDEDYNNKDIHECAICIDPALPENEGIEKAKERQVIEKLMVCNGCSECEESRKET